jgi:hypothetical protein
MKSHDPETLHYGPQFVPRNLEDKDGEPVLDPKTNEPIDLWKTKGLSDATPTNKGFSVAKAPQRAREQAGFDYYFNDDIHGYGTQAPARLQFGRDVQNWHHQQRPDVHESPEAVRVTGNAIADYLEGNNIPLPKKDDMQQPMIEASPTAKASILKNQTLYKRGGRIGYDYGGNVRTGDNPGGAADANRPAATSRDADRNYNAGSGRQYDDPSEQVMDRVQRDAGKEGASNLQRKIADDFLNVAGVMKNNPVVPQQQENIENLRANYLMYRPSKITQPQNLITPNDKTIVGGDKFQNRIPSINEPIKEIIERIFSS